jgi:hypothetical protein
MGIFIHNKNIRTGRVLYEQPVLHAMGLRSHRHCISFVPSITRMSSDLPPSIIAARGTVAAAAIKAPSILTQSDDDDDDDDDVSVNESVDGYSPAHTESIASMHIPPPPLSEAIATSSLVTLPAELYIHHILPCLSLRDLQSMSGTCRLFRAFSRAALSYSHPAVQNLNLPCSFYILSLEEWYNNILDHPEVRRHWLRRLSKRKKFIPLAHHDSIKLILASLMGQVVQKGTELTHLTSMLYRSFSIIMGTLD